MALDSKTSWKSAVSSSVDFSSARITLRAELGGTVLANAGESAERVRTSGAIPREGGRFPDNTSLLCNDVQITTLAPFLYDWKAKYEYQTPESGKQIEGLPVGWGFRRGTHKSMQHIDADINGSPIMTVTAESPNPPTNEEICDTSWTFTTTGRAWNEDLLHLFEKSVNSDVFLGKLPGQCKIDDIQSDVQFRSDGPPQMSVSVTVIVGSPPPPLNMWEFNTASGVWDRAARPREFYTWWKRVRAEGLKYRVANFDGKPVWQRQLLDANFAGSAQVPQNHYPDSGLLTQSSLPEFTHWYCWQTKPMLPFNILFNSL